MGFDDTREGEILSARNIGASAVAACGLLGLVSVRFIEITPSPLAKAVILIVGVLLVGGVAAVGHYKPHRGGDELKPLLRNRARRRGGPWLVIDKTFLIHVPDQGGLRRDASLEVTVFLRNRSRRTLGYVEFPIAGDSWVRAGDLDVVAEVDGQPTHAEVRYVDGNSPIVVVPMAAPGLRPGNDVAVLLRWTWPGMANMRSGTWTIGMNNVRPGSSTRIEVRYPISCPQRADVRLVKGFAGFHWDVPKGSLSAEKRADGLYFEFEHLKKSLDSLLCIDMTAESG